MAGAVALCAIVAERSADAITPVRHILFANKANPSPKFWEQALAELAPMPTKERIKKKQSDELRLSSALHNID